MHENLTIFARFSCKCWTSSKIKTKVQSIYRGAKFFDRLAEELEFGLQSFRKIPFIQFADFSQYFTAEGGHASDDYRKMKQFLSFISKLSAGIRFSKNSLAAEGGRFFQCLLLILDFYGRNLVSSRFVRILFKGFWRFICHRRRRLSSGSLVFKNLSFEIRTRRMFLSN